VHLYEAYLGIPPHLALFKHYFFLKYQLSAAKPVVIGGVGLQARACRNFIYVPLKTSLRGWHNQWFYYRNHEPTLPPFVGQFPTFDGTWTEEPTALEASEVLALVDKVNRLKSLGLTGVNVVPLKKQVHPEWEYSGLSDPTREATHNLKKSELHRVLGKMFMSSNNWPTPKEVHVYNISVAHDVVR
jgi:hypothetical protein